MALIVAGTSSDSVGLSLGDVGHPSPRVEALMQRHRGSRMQRRHGLDAQPADMEHRQHGQNMVLAGQLVAVHRVDRVPDQALLGVHRTLGLTGRAGGVDQQHRIPFLPRSA